MSRSTLQHVKRLILVYNLCQLDVSAGTAYIRIISLILEFFRLYSIEVMSTWSRILNHKSQGLLIQNKGANKLTFKFNS
jgi:hypothetical protein